MGLEAIYFIYNNLSNHGTQIRSRDGDYWELYLNKNLTFLEGKLHTYFENINICILLAKSIYLFRNHVCFLYFRKEGWKVGRTEGEKKGQKAWLKPGKYTVNLHYLWFTSSAQEKK